MLNRCLPAVFVMALAVALAACGRGTGGSSTSVRSGPPPTPPLQTLALPATVTSDGLRIIDIRVGDGQEAKAGDSVDVLYRSWLSDGTFYDTTDYNTTDIDKTPTTPAPTREILRKGEVLQGFVEGIPGMKVGGKRRLIIPPGLAYGSKGLGNAVPPNTTLIYDIELVQVVRHS